MMSIWTQTKKNILIKRLTKHAEERLYAYLYVVCEHEFNIYMCL